MSVAIALIALAMAAPGQAQQPARAPDRAPDAARKCRTDTLTQVDRGKQRVRPHSLSEEPLANQYLGVLHFVGKCEKPIVVREDIGGASESR